jgi:hypothetical protein
MISTTTFTAIDMVAGCIAILTFSIGLLWMLPCRLVPRVSTVLNETMALSGPAEAVGVPMGDYEAELAVYIIVSYHHLLPLTEASLHHQFIEMRTESHRSPGFFQQLCLLFLSGLTWRLYLLKWRIESIRRRIEVRQFTLLT